MKRSLFAAILAILVGIGPTVADGLPIRIDASRNGEVYIQKVGAGTGFELLKDSTPATYQVQPGERVDVRVVAQDGFFFRWEGNRQNLAGPSNVTIRLERSLAWERVAVAVGGAFLLSLALLLVFRRKTKVESEVARSQINRLQERVVTAEKVGSLARTLGDYEVLEKLGAGAMGVVYKVRDPDGGLFAAKVPNEMDERVMREADVSASLKSPNIVECFGLVTGEPNFLLMEYLKGETLHEWLEVHPKPGLDQMDRMVCQLLSALRVAHENGVFHRDLKPENLFLAETQEGRVLKVMDFGLASSIQAARLTRTGEAMGTPIYASPEQLSGNPIDSTTDLYSVGVLIYELATGKLPWSKTDPVALTLAKYKELPREPIVDRADLPMAWNQLVVDLLNGDPLKRPRSVDEVELRWLEGRKRIPRI
jgi:tRNA A-37 threonylcarbamoyl transferase component Bud32